MELKSEDNRPPLTCKGWAPGKYYVRCFKCGCDFLGDKRASQCADCAYIGVPEGGFKLCASQLELAQMIRRESLPFQYRAVGQDAWNYVANYNISSDWPERLVDEGFEIRILPGVLTEFLLPVGHALANPSKVPAAELTAGGKFRAVTVREETLMVHSLAKRPLGCEVWSSTGKWVSCEEEAPTANTTIRVPVTTPLPTDLMVKRSLKGLGLWTEAGIEGPRLLEHLENPVQEQLVLITLELERTKTALQALRKEAELLLPVLQHEATKPPALGMTNWPMLAKSLECAISLTKLS